MAGLQAFGLKKICPRPRSPFRNGKSRVCSLENHSGSQPRWRLLPLGSRGEDPLRSENGDEAPILGSHSAEVNRHPSDPARCDALSSVDAVSDSQSAHPARVGFFFRFDFLRFWKKLTIKWADSSSRT